MAPPVLKCINKEEREKDGFMSFKDWIDVPSHEYIGPNVHKYTRNFNRYPSLWVNPFYNHFNRYSGEEGNRLFEFFIRHNPALKECIPQLENKVMGCWCTDARDCHGEILIKLYKEYEEAKKQ
jgi:hypothetical protein